MTASAITSVNGNSARIAHVVAYGANVSLALVSQNDVRTCTFRILADSFGTADASLPAITSSGFATASFTMPADPTTGEGWAYICQTIVNENTPQQSIWTFILGVPASGTGIVPIPPGETTERDPRLGWLRALNQILATAGGGSVPTLGNGNIIIGGPSGNQIRPPTYSDLPARTITLNTSALYFSDPYWGGSTTEHDFSHNMEISTLLANESDEGILGPLGYVANAYLSTDGAGHQSFGLLPYVTNALRGVVPPITGANLALVSNSAGTGISWGQVPWASIGGVSITDSHVAVAAGIAVTKLATGGAGTVLYSSGSSNSWQTLNTLGIVRIGGDISGTPSAATVYRINGATVPASPTSGDIGKVFAPTGDGTYNLVSPATLGIPTVSGTPASGNFIVWNGSQFIYTPISVSTTLPLTGGGGYNPTLGINEATTSYKGAAPQLPGFNAVLTCSATTMNWTNLATFFGGVTITNTPTGAGQVLTSTGTNTAHWV